MQQWEYLTVILQPTTYPPQLTHQTIKKGGKAWNPNSFSLQLNYYGAQGWELVSFFTTQNTIEYTQLYVGKTLAGGITDAVFATFKRPLNNG